ncbi:MAG: L,D-transpeptidase family protein [Acidobacteria bacterium]|nr:L,D-transpeptidase family protein [Acidobacteriota bacterium]
MRRSLAAVLLMLLLPAPGAAAADPPAAFCAGRPATLVGTPGDDTLVGSPGPDVIVARAGNDTIRAGDGDDVVCAGIGDDAVSGGSGADLLLGQAGADVLVGNAGPDSLYGGAGDDHAYGGADGDLIAGGRGDDDLDGQDGDDRVLGQDGPDIAAGATGDDFVLGGPGDDLVDGGPGEDDCGGEPAPGCEVIALAPGATGEPVLRLQQALTTGLFYRGPIDGTYGQQTEFAAVAFHKATGRPRTTDWAYSDWAALGRFVSDIPDRPDEPDRIEVDVTRQILTLVEAGHVAAIIPVSTASGEPYVTYTGAVVYSRTPRGDFHLTHHGFGWQCSYIGCIYYPWFFTPHYAIHGYPNVPPWPASHGCVRVPVWESDWLEGHLAVGMAMHIWD